MASDAPAAPRRARPTGSADGARSSGSSGPSAPRGSRGSTANGPRILFVGLLVCWVLFPFLQTDLIAEDAIPFIAAGRIAAASPRDIYSGDQKAQVPTALRDAGCPMTPAGTDCALYVLPYLSSPQLLPATRAIGALGDSPAILVMRLLSVLAFAGGMWVLWCRVARDRPDAQVPLLVTGLLLTIYAYDLSAFGQNTPILFLSACLGLSRTDRPAGALGAAGAWVSAVLFKVFPLPLLLVAVLNKRWRFLAWSVALLLAATAITALVLPTSLFGDFVATTSASSADRVGLPRNVSLDSFVNLLDSSWRGTGAAFVAGVAVRVAAFGALAWWRLRDRDEDVQWAYGWVLLMALFPQIWWHYFELLIPAVVYSLRGRRGNVWWLVPGTAVAILPMAVLTDADTLKVIGAVLILAAAVALPFLSTAPGAVPSTVRPKAPRPARS